MNDYILLMFNDVLDPAQADDGVRWQQYLSMLRASGQFDGGSAIGAGERLKKGQTAQPAPMALSGFIRVQANDLDDAKRFLIGNPNYEAGGTIELRELPKT